MEINIEMHENDCPWCQCYPDNAPRCMAISRNNYSCTMPAGHDGPHVACGIDNHAIEVWREE